MWTEAEMYRKFDDVFKSFYKETGQRIILEKTHGDMFKSGLPDTFMTLPSGLTVRAELKRKWFISTCQNLYDLMRPSQRGNFEMLQKYTNAPLLVICGLGDNCTLAYADYRRLTGTPDSPPNIVKVANLPIELLKIRDITWNTPSA